MSKYYISLLSAIIFCLYGFMSQKYSFLGLGIIFAIIAWADFLKTKK